MKHFKNWNIAIKLYSTLSILLVMLLSLGIFSLYEASKINQRVTDLYHQELKPLETIEDMKTVLFQVRELVGRHLSEPELQTEHENGIQEQLQRLADNEAEYKKSRLVGQETRLLQAYKESWKVYLSLVNDRILPFSRNGSVEAAEDVLYGPALDSFRSANEAINELVEYQIERAERRFNNAQKAYATMRYLTIGIITIALLLAGGLGWFLMRNLVPPLLEVRRVLEGMDNGDLTQQADYQSTDEIGEMVTALNNSISKQRQMVGTMSSIVEQLSSSSEEMSAITEQSSQTIKEQLTETEMVATAMNEMTSTVQEVTTSISHTANAANEANTQTEDGNRVVGQAIDEINKLAEQIETSAQTINEVEQHSEAINAVLDVIKGVAEQTNLLALNAAIEAARAGEQGRGFAVVADEVRTLAGRTQQSTEEINDMIEKLQEGSRQAVLVMEQSRKQANSAVDYASQSGEALTTIAKAVGEINNMSTQIASAAEEQGVTSEEINRNIIRINEMAAQTAGGAEHIATASQDLANTSVEMQNLVGKFKF